MSAEQIQKFIAHKDELLGVGKPVKEGGGRAGVAGRADQGRGRSSAPPAAASSSTASRKNACCGSPQSQVILLDEKREFEVRFDDLMKAVTFPAWQFEAETAGMPSNKEPALFADALMPAVAAVRRAQGRLEQRIALLRHVEALRLYAVGAQGRTAREPVRDPRTVAGRPVHRQAVPL